MGSQGDFVEVEECEIGVSVAEMVDGGESATNCLSCRWRRSEKLLARGMMSCGDGGPS